MREAEWIIAVIAGYAAIGVVFGVLFVAVGIGRVDKSAERAPFSFRLLILPGVTALWPLMASKWLAAAREEVEA